MECKKSILEICGNKILERVNTALRNIINNINDGTTLPTKKRKLSIEIVFTPSEDRKSIVLTSLVKCKLEPQGSLETRMQNTRTIDDDTGLAVQVLKEILDEADGQMNIEGNFVDQEVIYIE